MKLPTQYMLPVPYETIEVDGQEWEVVTAGASETAYVVTLKKPGKGGNLYYLELDKETGEPSGSPRKMGNIEMMEGDSLDGLLRGLREDAGLVEATGADVHKMARDLYAYHQRMGKGHLDGEYPGDTYGFDAFAINLQRKMEDAKLTGPEMQYLAKLFGVRAPHRESARVISRQIVTALKEGKKPKSKVSEDADLEEASVPNWFKGFEGPGSELPAWAPPPQVQPGKVGKASPAPKDPGKNTPWLDNLGTVEVVERYTTYNRKAGDYITKERVYKGIMVAPPKATNWEEQYFLVGPRNAHFYALVKGTQYKRWSSFSTSAKPYYGKVGTEVEIRRTLRPVTEKQAKQFLG